jgi:branched-chain amino acid transport system ATP-binding protein
MTSAAIPSLPLLQVQSLTRQFGGLVAVDQVSFDVHSGEIFGLIGPNGAGKTTLFNMMTGLIRPTTGQMLCQQQAVTRLKPFQIASFGIARTFQNIRLFGNLSVLENVMIAHRGATRSTFLPSLLNLPPAPQAERETLQKAWELLTQLGLADRAHEQAKNLPYGDQRRLEIARALALRPQVLLLDEPAAGMNPNEKGQLSDLIREIQQQFNLTVLLIEHHVPLVMGLCDRIAVLNFGKLIALGYPHEIRDNPAVIEAYLGGS